MKLEENLTQAINYTKMLFDDFGKLLILIILDIIPIINFIVIGYLGNVTKLSPDQKKLPPLENYLDLWVQGLKIIITSALFMIIPIILIGPFLIFQALAWIAIPIISPISGIVGIILLILGILLAFFLAIILAMAIVNMLKKESFTEAFAIGKIMDIIGKIGWGSYIVWIIIIFICGAIVAAIGALPAIGWVLSFIIAPIFGTFVARSASLVYSEGTTIPKSPEADDEKQ